MRFLCRSLLLGLLAGSMLVALSQPAQAAETSNSEFVIIPEDDVFPEDLYAGAITVRVDGTLEGDLIAFAAEEIVINGNITGSVTAVSPSVVVNGSVGGSLRATGSALEVTGSVQGDVVAAVWSAVLSPTSDVAGDVLFWAWDVEALGRIGQDLSGTQRSLDLAGEVDGDVEVTVTRLRVVDPLTVEGDLGYRSNNEAEGLENADVAGVIVNQTPLPPNLRVRALSLLGRFMVILFLAIAALTTAYGWPERTARALNAVGERPVRNWLVGAAILFAPVLLILVTGVILGLAPAAAAFPLLVVLVPVILALTGLSLALGLVAGVPAVGWLGRAVFRRFELYGSILAGSVLAGVVWYLPWIGWLVPVIVLPLGLGAWISEWSPQSSESTELAFDSTA
jgi:cytoskeletal protein CcmA (bactofilin family)